LRSSVWRLHLLPHSNQFAVHAANWSLSISVWGNKWISSTVRNSTTGHLREIRSTQRRPDQPVPQDRSDIQCFVRCPESRCLCEFFVPSCPHGLKAVCCFIDPMNTPRWGPRWIAFSCLKKVAKQLWFRVDITNGL
jgi:hypothetical protein